MNALLRVEGLTKIFRSGESDLVVLEKLQLTAEAGEMVAIVGESGSGKSTLLHIVGALDKPTEGELYFDERAYSQMSAGEKEHLRNREIGFVWQLHFLLPEFTAQENVMMPLLIQGLEKREAKRRAGQWLARIGLQGRLTHRAGELSGGEQQRVALARALVHQPKLLMADEPTGNLDARTGEQTMQLLRSLHRECGTTTVLVTHNLSYAQRCHRLLKLENGRLEAVSFPQTV